MAELTLKRVNQTVQLRSGENTGAARSAAAAAQAARDAILQDAGFIAVAADLTGDNDIGKVAAGINDVGKVADDLALEGDSLIAQAPGAAAAAVAAAGSVLRQAPSYDNPGGKGDRTSSVTVAATGTGAAVGTPSNLVDGATGNNTADSYRLPASTSVTGMTIIFDFGPGARKLITEATGKFQSTQSLGSWEWSASNDGVNWTAIGSPFALASATTQAMTELSANVLGYRYYKLAGESGSTSATLNFIQEFEFKIAATDSDGVLPLPPGGQRGQVAKKGSAANADIVYADPHPMHTAEMIDEWLFDEMAGVTAHGFRGGNHIVFDETYQTAKNSSPEWTRHGLKLELDMIETPAIAGVRTVAMLVRVKRNVTTGFILNCSAIVGGNGVQCQSATPGWGLHVGRNGVRAVRRHTDGTASYQLNRSGWYLLFVELPSQQTTTINIGGRYNFLNKDTAYRPTEMEIGWMGAWSDTLTADERRDIDRYVRAIAARKGDILMNWRDTANWWDQIAIWGQSNALGRAPIANLSADDRARTFPNSHIASRRNVGISNFDGLSELVLGQNQHPEHPATQFGPEFAALAHEDARTTRRRPIAWAKAARGSTRLAASSLGTPTTPSESWNINEPIGGGVASLFHHCGLLNFWDVEAQLLARGIGPRPRALWWLQGEADGNSTTYSAVYQANLQALWDEAKIYCGFEQMVIARTTNVWPSFDPDAVAEVRAAQAAIDAANSDVVMIDADPWPLLADNIHFNTAGMKTGSAALYAATSLA
ncbi:MAG TPA: sialate O-acetylesterase [Sphingopyxis sp.]|nr:sialate O-acetylesterase [Sphingopyxis sp.]HMP43892.1 sialate O-acetylesterase [Sphingopyxis sp.]